MTKMIFCGRQEVLLGFIGVPLYLNLQVYFYVRDNVQRTAIVGLFRRFPSVIDDCSKKK